MTKQTSPITPPLDLVTQWFLAARAMPVDQWVTDVATAAAQWGWDKRGAANEVELQQRADQELEACLEWISKQDWTWTKAQLLAARRPKPLSEADLALDALGPEPLPENTPLGYTFLNGGAIEKHRQIRRALERLKKLEESNND